MSNFLSKLKKVIGLGIKPITTATPEGEKLLRQKTPLFDFGENSTDQQNKAKWMKILVDFREQEICYAMAGSQLGIPAQVFCLYHDVQNLMKAPILSKFMFNPEIIDCGGETEFYESCMSCVDKDNIGVFARVKRPFWIKVKYMDENGTEHIERFENFIATVICHEMAHFRGQLHKDIAEEIIIGIPKNKRNEYRTLSPYNILRKDGEYTEPSVKKPTEQIIVEYDNSRSVAENIENPKYIQRPELCVESSQNHV